MPNPILVNKKMIDETAFKMVKNHGLDILSARNIAKEIGCSTKPIYRVYKNMEELKGVVIKTSVKYMKSYIYGYKKTTKPLLDSGLGYINFAKTEKELFKLINMNNKLNSEMVSQNNELFDLIATELSQKKFNDEKLFKILEQLIIFTYGLAMICFLDIYQYSEDELEKKLYDFFKIISK